MRVALWIVTFLLIGSLGFNFYLLVEEISPLKRELFILQDQNKKLFSKLNATSVTKPTAEKRATLREEHSLLEGVSTIKDTFTLEIKTLKIFKRYKTVFSGDGKGLLKDFIKSFPVKGIKRVEITIYQGPYKTLTRGRLKVLEDYFVKLGVSKGLISLRADDSIKKWTTMIRVIL